MSDEKTLDFASMTNEELLETKKNLEKAYEKLCEDRARDLKEIDTKNFDPYTYFGGQKIEKIVKKYAELDDGFAFLMEELAAEFKRRQIPISDLEIIEDEKLSDEEYIVREIKESNRYKQNKKNNNEE